MVLVCSDWLVIWHVLDHVTTIQQFCVNSRWDTVFVIAVRVLLVRVFCLSEHEKNMYFPRPLGGGGVMTGGETWIFQYDPETKRRNF